MQGLSCLLKLIVKNIFTNWFWFCNVDLITVTAVVDQVGNVRSCWASCLIYKIYFLWWLLKMNIDYTHFFVLKLGQTHLFWLMMRCFPAHRSSWGTFSLVEYLQRANVWREEREGVLLQHCKYKLYFVQCEMNLIRYRAEFLSIYDTFHLL